MAIVWALARLAALVVIVLLAGSRVVPWVLERVARLRSRELFTLTVLVLSVTIAVGSYTLFGASVALGAFLAGMVVAQSPASHQAAADALPMRDAFAVLFFVSVGMLFDPAFLVHKPLMVAIGLGIVLLVKPLAALLVVATLGYPARTALTVAIGLAQIGEFSFILAQVSKHHGLLPEDGQHVVIATAMISITLNPLLFRNLDRIEAWAQRRPLLWRMLNSRSERRGKELNARSNTVIGADARPLAIIVGYGPVGRVVDALVRDAGLQTVIVDSNIETVRSLAASGRPAIYGDGTHPDVLAEAGLRRAVHLIVTLPHSSAPLVRAAREMNPTVEITVRARYLADGEVLRLAGATHTVFEEGEAGIALARQVMERRGVDPGMVQKLLEAIRKLWKMKD